MPPLAVVKDFYIPKDVFMGISSCFVLVMIEHFAFYRAEKRFRTSVIIAIAFAAHGADHPVFAE